MASIFVAKLDFGVTNDDLRSLFQQYGTVLKATVAMDKETGKSRGFAFVEMANDDEAKAAISALDGFTVNGRQIAVKEAEQRGDNRGPRDNNNFKPRDNNYNSNYKGNNNRNEGGGYKPKGDFNKSNEGGGYRNDNFKPRDTDDFPRKSNDDDDDKPVYKSSSFELPKIDPRNKKVDKEKEKKKPADDDKSKKTKLNPYKKSGKNNRFFDDEDDDDFDPNTASLFDYDDEDDDWDDEDDNEDED